MAILTSRAKDVAFTTIFRYENVHMKGRINSSLGSTAVVTHNLGYVPYVKIWYVYNNTYFPASSSFASPYSVIVRPKVNTLELENFSGIFGTFGDPITLFYRIYKEPAA